MSSAPHSTSKFSNEKEGMLKTWSDTDNIELEKHLKRVRDDNRYWPTEESFRIAHQIIPVPNTEVALVDEQGRLLLFWRDFSDWPEGYHFKDWYICGGYIPWGAGFQESCETHLRKDLQAEYARIGTTFDPKSITLSEPEIIHVEKWQPGKHPFGCPISLLCVCTLKTGDIIETDRLKWVDHVVPTEVPYYTEFQELVFNHLQKGV